MSDATNPAVAPDEQRYGHAEAMADIFDLAHIETEFAGHDPRVTGLAAYIERLEAERDALLAEHEAVGEAMRNGVLAIEVEAAYIDAERTIHGE